MLTVQINGQAATVAAGSTIAELVRDRTGRDAPLGVAVARNKDVVPRSLWHETPVEDGDEIELVGVMQGG